MQSWQMQSARAQFSELLEHATRDGPQDITLHGKSVAVLVSREMFDRLSGKGQTLVDFMRASPLAGHDEVLFERNRSLPRAVVL